MMNKSRKVQTLSSYLQAHQSANDLGTSLSLQDQDAINVQRTSSILHGGLRSDNDNAHSAEARVEYLGHGGAVDVVYSHPRNTVCEFDMSSECILEKSAEFYVGELRHDALAPEFFSDLADDYELYDARDVLGWCSAVLDQSPTARIMLKEAGQQGWKISLEDLSGSDYCLDVDQKLLIMDNNALVPTALARSGYFRNLTLLTMTKALRDIWQEKRHGGFDELYSPEHIMLMERVRAADLDVVSILVAWELRSEDYTDLWRHVIGSDIGDLAMTFSGYLERDPSAQFNRQGLVATFKQWFREPSRINLCDRDTLDYMDEVLFEQGGNPFGDKRPTKIAIELLSCLPDKTAYLHGHGDDIINDPSYSSLENEFNQTHLFHIMHDMCAIIVEDVPFRDAALARKIFPQ